MADPTGFNPEDIEPIYSCSALPLVAHQIGLYMMRQHCHWGITPDMIIGVWGGGDTHLGYGIVGVKKSGIWDMGYGGEKIWDMGYGTIIWDMGYGG